MPVGTHFNQQFAPGDVIYGISQARAPYVNSLPHGFADNLRAQGDYVICDEFNNRTIGQVTPYDFGRSGPDSKRSIKSNLKHHKRATYLNAQQKGSTQHYYNRLKKSKYAPLKAAKVKDSKLQAKGNASTEDLVFRRACKFGLQYIIQHMQRTVHFVLDVPAYFNVPGNRIDSLDVVLKNQHAGHVPITTSELRCCYRNRANWIPLGRLKFYFNLLEVHPPWVDEPEVWAIYEAHRIMKGRV